MPLTKTVNGQSSAAKFTLSLYPDLGGAHVNAAIFPTGANTPLASLSGPAFPSITVLGGPFVVCEMGTFDGVNTSDGFPSGSAASWTVNGISITAGGVAVPLDASASHIVPAGFPGFVLGTVTAPPRVELPGPTGVFLSVCEMGVPDTRENLSWTVEITVYGSNKPDQVINFLPYDSTIVRPDFYNPDYFLFGVAGASSGNRCINVTIPLGTDRFEIFVNNATGRGRMTGGGSVFTTLNQEDTRVTHGFELHCNANDDPNHLQINWNGNRFHLDDLVSGKCTTDRRLDGTNRPAAGFNMFEGAGIGRYNGEAGYKATWVFTDAGEPGTGDTVALRITNAAGNTTILTVGSINTNGNGGIVNSAGVPLTFGNHQAHR